MYYRLYKNVSESELVWWNTWVGDKHKQGFSAQIHYLSPKNAPQKRHDVIDREFMEEMKKIFESDDSVGTNARISHVLGYNRDSKELSFDEIGIVVNTNLGRREAPKLQKKSRL